MENKESAFSGGKKVTFNTNGTYSSGPNNNDNKRATGNQNSAVNNYTAANQSNTVNSTNAYANNANSYTNTGASNSYSAATTQTMPTQSMPTQDTNTYSAVNTSSTNTTNDKETEKKRNIKTFIIAFAGALLAILLVIIGLNIYKAVTGKGTGSTVLGATESSIISSSDDSDTLAEAVSKKCLPSVVSISVYTNSSKSASGMTLSSTGSGIILSADGYVVTNQHVISGAAAIRVTANGTIYDADLVGEDSSSDIAVVKLKNASGLSPIEIGNSENIKIGEWVMAIGCPFGLEQSVSTGIVSATSRSQVVSSETDGTTKVYPNLIQTDAAINPGNSGGALVNKNGQLIGINALIQSTSGTYSGVGFAIPSNYAIDLSKQIIDGKSPSHAQLGITMTTVTSDAAKQYGWNVSQGAYVSSVSSGSAAEKAGIKVGDIITKADGSDITSSSDMLLAVRSHNPGDTMTLTINRAGQESQVEVTLGSDEGQTQQKSNSNSNNNNSQSYSDIWKYFFGQ